MKKLITSIAFFIFVLHNFAQTKSEKHVAVSESPSHASGLSSFSARPLSDHVQINWLIISATNTSFFTIERSADLVNYESINRVNGNANESAVMSYQIDDYAPYNGVSYYRLKLTDTEGRNFYSEVQSVVFASPLNLTFIRNETSRNYILEFKTLKDKEDNYTIEIANALGETVYKENLVKFIGHYSHEIDLINYGKTAYIITISNSTEKIAKRVIAY